LGKSDPVFCRQTLNDLGSISRIEAEASDRLGESAMVGR
jgi:hypothetical protein